MYSKYLLIILSTFPLITRTGQDSPTKPFSPVAIATEIAVGELIDKITILQIKKTHVSDNAKVENISYELNSLLITLHAHVPPSRELDALMKELHTINQMLWDIEDAIRDKERAQLFDEEFIVLARSVYFTNDLRCKIKRAINDLCGSHIIEEKSYSEYTR
jgi:hypothetical protein